jgi:signal transduction histidine kinase
MSIAPPWILWRRLSTSARLTLSNAALFALVFSALLVLVTWVADRYMRSHVRESVDAEMTILLTELRLDGLSGVRELVEQRLRDNTTGPVPGDSAPNHDRLYRLEDAQGQVLAGNVDEWPAAAGEPGHHFQLPSRRFPGRTEVILRWAPLPDGGRLLVGFDEIEIAQVRDDIRHAALWGLLIMLLLSLSTGYLVSRAALRPVEAIRDSAQRIMGGDLRHRIPVRHPGDEFDRLGETLNSMLDRINVLIASVSGATDNIAHDLRSPLTRHRARLESALYDPPDAAAFPAWIERNLADLDQVLATFQALLRIATVESGLLRQEFEACDIPQLVQDAADYMEPLLEDRQQQLHLRLTPGPLLLAHRHLLFQLLINLLDNAVKYSPPNTTIKLAAMPTERGWTLEVADAGPGIPAAERDRVLERLYRLDASRHTPGLGLGLSLAKAIVDLHRGRLTIADHAPGTRVGVSLG